MPPAASAAALDADAEARAASYGGPEVLAHSLGRPLPVVGIPACVKLLPPHPFHSVGDKYLRAVRCDARCPLPP
jgi:hypothetical protein